MTLAGATVASIWGDIFHHPDDETVLDDALACVRWMYSEWDGLSGCKKRPHDVAFNLYMFSRCPHDKPRFNTEASARRRGM